MNSPESWDSFGRSKETTRTSNPGTSATFLGAADPSGLPIAYRARLGNGNGDGMGYLRDGMLRCPRARPSPGKT